MMTLTLNNTPAGATQAEYSSMETILRDMESFLF